MSAKKRSAMCTSPSCIWTFPSLCALSWSAMRADAQQWHHHQAPWNSDNSHMLLPPAIHLAGKWSKDQDGLYKFQLGSQDSSKYMQALLACAECSCNFLFWLQFLMLLPPWVPDFESPYVGRRVGAFGTCAHMHTFFMIFFWSLKFCLLSS